MFECSLLVYMSVLKVNSYKVQKILIWTQLYLMLSVCKYMLSAMSIIVVTTCMLIANFSVCYCFDNENKECNFLSIITCTYILYLMPWFRKCYESSQSCYLFILCVR